MAGKCFVLMPFSEPFNTYYTEYLVPAIKEAGFAPERADEIYGNRLIITDIYNGICESAVILADVSGKNPNVNFEMGIAAALERPVVIIAQSVEDIPFDLRHRRAVIYNITREDWGYKLKTDIVRTFKTLLEENKTIEDSLGIKQTYLHIVNKKSEKCLDIDKWGTHNGAKIHQWKYHGNDSQIWVLRPAGGGYYYVVNKHSKKCLDVEHRSLEDGARIQQWEYVGNNNQNWIFYKHSDGSYQINAKHSLKCLDVLEQSDANGMRVVQTPWEGHDSQRWWLRLVL